MEKIPGDELGKGFGCVMTLAALFAVLVGAWLLFVSPMKSAELAQNESAIPLAE